MERSSWIAAILIRSNSKKKEFAEQTSTAHCSPQEQRGEMGLGSGEGQKGPVLYEPDGLIAHTALRLDFEVLSIYKHYLYLSHNLNIKTKSPYQKQQLSILDPSTSVGEGHFV